MSIFYSPAKKGFFDERFHGPRQIDVVDEKALEEQLAEAAAYEPESGSELAQAIAAARQPAEEEEDPAAGEQRARAILDAARAGRAQAIQDAPPLKTIDNPDTGVPEDAIPLDEGQYERMIGAVNSGQAIEFRDGELFLVDAELDVDAQIEAMRRRRDKELRATDWTQVPDAMTAAKRKLWASHRQALRDLPLVIKKALKEGKSIEDVPFPKAPA